MLLEEPIEISKILTISFDFNNKSYRDQTPKYYSVDHKHNSEEYPESQVDIVLKIIK